MSYYQYYNLSFNSTLVQLKGASTVTDICAEICFNSTLVQLKVRSKNY